MKIPIFSQAINLLVNEKSRTFAADFETNELFTFNYSVMKKNFVMMLCGLAAVVMTACNENKPEAGMVEGGWELRTMVSDHTVYADMTGTTHYSDEGNTRTYDTKEEVWLFYEGHISKWQYAESDGQSFWDGYLCDCERTYTVVGEYPDPMYIEERSRSTIPGDCGTWSTQRYQIEKLTSREMVLTTVNRMYVSQTKESVDVNVTCTFRRENTLLGYLKKHRDGQQLEYPL